MLNKNDAVELVTDTLQPLFDKERLRLATIDLWYRWEQEPIKPPTKATPELQSLIELSRTPWLNLVVTTVAQSMRVDGYRTPEERDDSGPWRIWRANGLNGRQRAIHRAMLAYGVSYATALPGVSQMTGEPMAVLRGVSPRKMLAFYQSPAEDEWPMYALRSDGDGQWRLYDDEAVYRFGVETSRDGSGRLVYLDDQIHDVGVCPVVRYSNMLDLDGRTDGEVEPFIDMAKRINKTTYDRLLIQHFNSWKVRTVSGMAQPDATADQNLAEMRLRHGDLLVSEDVDTKFGTLPETPMDGVIRAAETDIKALAAVSQTPTHALTGDMINLSAEALAAARESLDAKSGERKQSAGESHAQLLRLGAHIMGDDVSANDIMAEVTWADTSVRSFSQAADALGKLATMLGIPVQALWSKVPGASKTDVDEWKAMAAESDVFGQLTTMLDGQATPQAADPATVKAQADAMGILIRSGVEPLDAAKAVGLNGLGFTGAVPVTLRQPASDAASLEST